MTKVNLFAIAMASSLIFSCAKEDSKNNAAVQDGLCTSATVDAYNNVVYAAQRISKYSSSTDLYSLQSACNSYKSLIGNNSCKLQLMNRNTFVSEDSVVSRNSHDQVCNAADSALNELNKPKTAQPQTPAVKDIPETTLPGDMMPLKLLGTALDESLSAQILNLAALVQVSKDLAIIQGGKTFDIYSTERDASQPYCIMISTQLDSGIKELNFKSFKISDSKEYIEISNIGKSESGLFTQLNCFNGAHKNVDELTVKDLRNIFKGLLKIEYVLNF